MFGFGKKKGPEPERARRSAESKERKSQNRAQLGFLVGDDGDIDNLMGNMDVGDEDLEEELAMLLEGKQPALRKLKSSPQKGPIGSVPAGRKPVPIDFDTNDFDNEVMENDEDVDDDPDLEAELGDILGLRSSSPKATTPMDVSGDADDDDDENEKFQPQPTMTTENLLLNDRLELYEKAKSAATSVGDSSKARRFDRGVKTLKGLISKAKAGRVIDESEIPPVVSIGVINQNTIISKIDDSQPPPTTEPLPIIAPADIPPRSNPGDDIVPSLPSPLSPTPAYIQPPPTVPPRLSMDTALFNSTSIVTAPAPTVDVDPLVEERLKEYKLAAVTLKRQGDVQGALKYLKLSKALNGAVKTGEAVNLLDYPPLAKETAECKDLSPAAVTAEETSPVHPTNENIIAEREVPPPPSEDLFGAPPPPKTIMEALEQRYDKYKSEVEKANAASNSSKARRMGRIVKQYEEAIALHRKGKPVPFDELPTPPGFAPIPSGGPPPATVPISEPQSTSSTQSQGIGTIAAGGSPEKKPKAESPKPGSSMSASGKTPPGSQSSISRSGKPATKLTLQETQLQIIIQRQQQFKEAAINAKKRGDITQAREFLRTAKGFDNLIKVAQAGLPVDMATLPSPPEAVAKLELEDESNFELVNASDCIMPSGGSTEVFSKLEDDLKQQLKMCMRTREHFKAIGDVGSANRFESMALESKRDLDALRLAMKQNGAIPKYHYENRIFSITECNTDVAENEIEINIIQGINYKVTNPSDVDTYIKIELPYPTAEEVQTNKTQVVKDTNNPTYNATYKMSINRTARNFQRFVHRHGIKCEVWSKGGLCSGGFFFCKCNSGFLRGSTLIGTATVKLMPLETKCTLHDVFDVLEGRKKVGKLEVKVKIREPVVAKQITQKKEMWLSIDRT